MDRRSTIILHASSNHDGESVVLTIAVSVRRPSEFLAGAFHQPDASSSCSSAGAGAGRLSDCVRRGPRPPRLVYAEARDLVRPLPLFLAAVPGYLALLAAGPPIGGAMGERPEFIVHNEGDNVGVVVVEDATGGRELVG